MYNALYSRRKLERGREREESYDEMDGKSSDLPDAVFTGRVEMDLFTLYIFSVSEFSNHLIL